VLRAREDPRTVTAISILEGMDINSTAEASAGGMCRSVSHEARLPLYNPGAGQTSGRHDNRFLPFYPT
jgi:hypothetical protein